MVFVVVVVVVFVVFCCCCLFFLFLFFLFFIKISKLALPGVMLKYERASNDRKKTGERLKQFREIIPRGGGVTLFFPHT